MYRSNEKLDEKLNASLNEKLNAKLDVQLDGEFSRCQARRIAGCRAQNINKATYLQRTCTSQRSRLGPS